MIRFVACAAIAALAGCSGGSSPAGASLHCSDGSGFCISSCDLGCSTVGCALTQVAENQRLQFRFNQAVDPNSVNGASFSIRTVTGQTPDGDVLVEGSSITFVPQIRVTGGVTTFGFERNETYILTFAGGPSASQSVKSHSGTPLSREFTCTVTASLGIIDEDNAPPRATLVAPTDTTAAPVDATYVIRFSEVIDTTALNVSLSASSPIRFFLHQTVVNTNNERVCDNSAEGIVLEGVPVVTLENVNGRDVTTVSFRPEVTLPGQSCVEIDVTADLHDVSGRAAEPITFQVITAPTTINDLRFDELFVSPARMDTLTSGGTWNNGARPAVVGGDGRHGSFDPTIVLPGPGGVYVFDTTNTRIPGNRTFNGNDAIVTDGRYFFTDFVVPENTTVHFGSLSTTLPPTPAQIFVRGRVEIRGRVEANGAAMTIFQNHNTTPSNVTPIPGQPGGAPGAGGAPGGRGGDRNAGTAVPLPPQTNGQTGGNVNPPATHAYFGLRGGTGGTGSASYPPLLTSGLAPTNFPNGGGQSFSAATAAGGGGGGYNGPGGTSSVPVPPPFNPPAPNPPNAGPSNAGGSGFSLLPFPTNPPPNYSSLIHYLVGGSGGGGGGSMPLYGFWFPTAPTIVNPWAAGAGGSGGGGAFALRAGGSLTITALGNVEAKGGAGAVFNGDDPTTGGLEFPGDTAHTTNNLYGLSSPGGGGSGGSVLLQADGAISLLGGLNTSGGNGSSTNWTSVNPTFPVVRTVGGAGATGNYRLESNNPVQVAGAMVPPFVAAVNQGPLNDRDDQSGCESIWRGTGLVFPPQWLRYEIDVDLDGDGTVDRLYTDDASIPSAGPANDPLGPLALFIQGARVSTTTGLPLAGTVGPWRSFVNANAGPSLNLDTVTGFRFQMIFNRRDFPNVVIRRFTVFARG